MFFSKLEHFVQSHLTVKLVLLFVLFFSAVSLLLTYFFMSYQKSILTHELQKRARSLAQNLVYNSRNYFDRPDISIINSFVLGVCEEPDIKNVYLTDVKGKILSCADTSHPNIRISIPANITDQGINQLLSITQIPINRTIVPVEINDALTIDINSPLIPPSRKDIYYQAGKITENMMAGFAPDSDEISFLDGGDQEVNFHMMSISIHDRKLRLLLDIGANGFWSHNGRYMAFNKPLGIEKSDWAELCLFDKKTGTVKSIVKRENDWAVPCFTPDDKYIITHLEAESGFNITNLFKFPCDGGEPEQLTFLENFFWYPDCSPDGKWILISDIWLRKQYVYDTETKKVSRVFPDLKDDHWCGSFSPDGKKICYHRCLDAKSFSWDIFIADFPLIKKSRSTIDLYGVRLTNTGGLKHYVTRWSPDGKWIAYTQVSRFRNISRSDICVIPSQGGEPINLTESPPTHRQVIGYAVLDVSLASLNRAVSTGNHIALLIFFLFNGIGALGAFFLVRNVVNPVQRLRKAAGEIAQGNLDQQVTASRNDEIGDLAVSFNRMTEQLKVSREEIEVGSLKLAKKHDELEKAYRELDSLDKAKDNFISLVSHEIRTPLSSILMYSEMLKDGLVKSEDKARTFHNIIVEECKRLTRLINDVLDLSKMEAGRMTFTSEILNIRELVQEVFTRFQANLANHRLHSNFDKSPEDLFLRGNRDKVIQVLTNIISNSIKFTPEGGTISASWQNGEGVGIVSIADNGKGIPKDDIPKVFDRFCQLENMENHSGGTGLGMTISKSIIENLGGKIWIESTIGKGTTVFFTLPLAEIVPESKEQITEVNSLKEPNGVLYNEENNSFKILIVDDDESLRAALSECVQSTGYTPLLAADGQEGLEMVQKHQPDLIMLDVMLPRISGLEVCRTIRNNPDMQGIKIIILSALGQEKDKLEGFLAGADRYMTKPFSYEELMSAVAECSEK
jgi:signal transduction histidine kinase/CheY-like chemotaxis protein/Tol biopolymer transport system component